MKYLISLLLFSSLSFAGDKGNGGISLVCRNEKNIIISAELLDIYEGKVLAGKTYIDNRDIPTKLNFATNKIAHIPGLTKILKEKITFVISNMYFVPHGNELLPTDDAFPVVKKTGCKFEQLANFTRNNEIYISIEIFEKLDTLNKVALILHEAVYATRRMVGDQDSHKTRKIVAELMSEDTNMGIVNRFIRPSELAPGTYESMFKDGCLLVLSEDGWSFTYQKAKLRDECSSEKFDFEFTEEKNVFIFSRNKSWFKVTGPETFFQSFNYDSLMNGKAISFKKIR